MRSTLSSDKAVKSKKQKEPKMATATQSPTVPQATGVAESNITSERSDYVVGHNIEKTKDDKGNDVVKHDEGFWEVTKEDQQQFVKKLVEDGKFLQSYQVTVSIPRAKNFAGIKEICPNEEECAANFNRGAKQKANNRLSKKLLDTDEEGRFLFNPETDLKNGVLDMTEEIASPSQRKVLTEEEKLDRFLEQFPESTRNMMKQAYLASRQAPAGAPALVG